MTKTVDVKELGFYSHDYGVDDEQLYLSFFDDAIEGQQVGEICHSYLTTPESAQEIKKANPDARILIILRNPVDRAYSMYHWSCVHGYESSSTFEKGLNQEKRRLTNDRFRKKCPQYFWNYMYKKSSHYAEQIRRYETLFPEHVLVMIYEEFSADPASHLEKIRLHLGLAPFEFDLSKRFNIGRKTYAPGLQYALKNYLRRNRNRPTRHIRKYLMKLNSSGTQGPMAASTRKKLQEYFEPHIKELETLLGRSLEHWRK